MLFLCCFVAIMLFISLFTLYYSFNFSYSDYLHVHTKYDRVSLCSIPFICEIQYLEINSVASLTIMHIQMVFVIVNLIKK